MANAFPGLGPDKVVLISAGAAGIGRCIAEGFLAQGCAVHVCDISRGSIDEFIQANPGASASCADVSDAQQVERVIKELLDRYQGLDILVNNAGIAGPTAAVEDIAVAEWDRTLSVDLNGVFYTTRLAVPLLKRQGGSIINMASSAGTFGCPMRSPYVAAKWALNGLTKTWAMELGSSGIRVNSLCPGSVNGERIRGVIEWDARQRGISEDEVRDDYLGQSSMQLFVEPEDVANMAVFLASELGAKVSGQFIGIDGHTETLGSSIRGGDKT